MPPIEKPIKISKNHAQFSFDALTRCNKKIASGQKKISITYIMYIATYVAQKPRYNTISLH